MNEHKLEWMAHATLLLPTLITRIDEEYQPRFQGQNGINSAGRLRLAVKTTQKAAGIGLALSAIDGPLPIMDVVGFGFFSVMSIGAWINFFENL